MQSEIQQSDSDKSTDIVDQKVTPEMAMKAVRDFVVVAAALGIPRVTEFILRHSQLEQSEINNIENGSAFLMFLLGLLAVHLIYSDFFKPAPAESENLEE